MDSLAKRSESDRAMDTGRKTRDSDVETVSGEMKDRTAGLQRLKLIAASTPVLPVLLLVSIVIFSLASDAFLSPRNFVGLANQATFLIVVSLGQALVLISGGFDLSVGAIVGLSSVVTATVLVTQGNFVVGAALGIGAGILSGALVGAANGISVSRLGVPPFIVTLATASIATGLALILSRGIPIINLPEWFPSMLGTGSLDTVSTPMVIAVLLSVVIAVVASRMVMGRSLYAVGGNDRAARLSGIRVKRVLSTVYISSGVFAGIAGVLMAARVATGDANLGAHLVMSSITACVLGGVSLRGGEGKIWNVVIGALFVTVLSNGMNLAGVQTYYQMVVLGVLLVGAVIIENLKRRVLQSFS